LPDLVPAGAQLATLLFLLLPGSVFLWAFERMAGPVGVRGADRLLRAVAWSVILLAAVSPWLVRLGRAIASRTPVSPWELWGAGVVITLFGPLTVAFVMTALGRSGLAGFIRRRLRFLAALDPSPTAWDRVFGPREAVFVRAKLKDGSRVGGYLGPGSFASSYPERQDLFIEQQWWLDGDGVFLRPIAGTRGLLVAREDVLTVELLAATMVGERS